MDKHHAELIAAYDSTPDTVRALVHGLSDDDVQTRGKPGSEGEVEWSVAEIVAHLYDAEWPWFERVRRMREENHPYLPVYPNADYTKTRMRESLEKFCALRAEQVEYLKGLSDEEWQRDGRHELWGDITILWAVHHIAGHDASHLAQIARRVLVLPG